MQTNGIDISRVTSTNCLDAMIVVFNLLWSTMSSTQLTPYNADVVSLNDANNRPTEFILR